MIKVLTTTATNHYLIELLKGNARRRIVLVSPFIRLHPEILELLASKKAAGLDIDVVCRASATESELPTLREVATRVLDLEPALSAT